MQLSKLQEKKISINKGILKYILEFQKIGEGLQETQKEVQKIYSYRYEKINNTGIKLNYF